MSMCDQQTGLGTAGCKAQPEDDIVKAGFEDLQKHEAGNATRFQCFSIIAPELGFINAINAASFLLGTQLLGIIRLAALATPRPTATGAAMLTGGKSTALECALGSKATLSL
jgi:hypothetical protein